MPKPFAWSYSALNAFETCPRQFQELRLLKRWPQEETEALRFGKLVHSYLEDRFKKGKELPVFLTHLEPIVHKLETSKGPVQAEYKLTLNAQFQPVDWFAKDAWVRAVGDVIKVHEDRALALDWKGLPLDTELPTPDGFTTMAQVQVGSRLFSRSGAVCRVVGKSQVHHRRCFRVEFDDKTSVVCDDQHLWSMLDGSVKPVLELVEGDLMPVCEPVQYETQELPIDPYVLGVWLADGKHSSGELSKPDRFVWEEIQRRGFTVGERCPSNKDGKTETRTVYGLRTLLRKAGLLGNKHIPGAYLCASIEQRLDLLRGLMDGDGNANPTRKQAVFTTTHKEFSDQVKQLAASLGFRVNQCKTRQRGFGREVDAWPLHFRPTRFNPFLTPVKADRIDPAWGDGHSTRRRVERVVEVQSVPTQCIAVDSPDNTYLCTRDYLVTHNTGKYREGDDQLKLQSAVMFASYPHVKEITVFYAWVKDKRSTVRNFKREDTPAIWGEFLPRVKRMELAKENDDYPPKPSGLCRKHCPVKTCEFYEKGAY